MEKEFDDWIFKVCEHLARGRKDPHDIYPLITLSEAKIAFMSGMSPEEFKL